MGKFDRVLIASDFDNTLVDTQAAIDAKTGSMPLCGRNRAALEYFMANGGHFTVSTGRALPAFTDYVDDVPHNAPCILANGAVLYDFAENRVLHTAYIGERIRAHMAEVFAAFPETSCEIYHEDRRIHAINPNRYIKMHEHLTRTAAVVVESFEEIDLPIIKVLFEDDEPILHELEAFLRSREWIGEYELIFSSDFLLELTARGATKGDMVLRLAGMLGVERKDVYCVGDHKNDIPMLAVAAEGFAPANCVPEVAASGATVLCHCRDGVIADVIELLDKQY